MNLVPTRHDGPDGRFYNVNGVLLPSVTNILTAVNKPALVPWAANCERKHVSEAAADLYAQWSQLPAARIAPLSRQQYLTTLLTRVGQVRAHQRVLEQAGDIGSECHRLIEWTMRDAMGARAGDKPIVCDEARGAVGAFLEWARSVSLKPVLIERTVYSTVHGYAGTLDLLARVNGELTQVDFKTGKAIYREAFLQSAAYTAALEEMGYRVPTAALIVRLPKATTDPRFDVQRVPPVAELLPVFLGVKTVWQWQQANEANWRKRRSA
jgi:hypothetical protein